MSSIVTALYDTREEADRALRSLNAEVHLAHAGIYDGTRTSLDALRRFDLTPEERGICEGKLATGAYLLLAQVGSGGDPDRIIRVLERSAAEPSRAPDLRAAPARTDARQESSTVVAEERLPVIEEELRVGTREVVRGGARVRTRVEELPVTQEVELLEEFVRVDKRPANRRVGEQELEQAGLLRERVIEIAQVRQEAVVHKEAFVREEIVLRKTTTRRVEQIRETIRRTEVETEELGGDAAGFERSR